MNDTEDTTIAELRDEADKTLQGQAHLFCALASALERSGALDREVLRQAIREKIEWLTHHNVDLGTATPLLMAEQWLTDPPPNPRDPYDGTSRDFLRPV